MGYKHSDRPTWRAVRLAELERMRCAGIDPYPARFDSTTSLVQLRASSADFDALVGTQDSIKFTGRVALLRDHGGIWFVTLESGGAAVQLLCDSGNLAPPRRGDIIGVTGSATVSGSGESSVRVHEFELLAASLVAPGDKRGRPGSVEHRSRNREADLINNLQSRKVFTARSQAISAIRTALDVRGFLEVETPVFSAEAGGATARPFVTRHNALGQDLSMRIAPELFLKRLVIGGMDRIFELGRVFRNEGMSAKHNPEFTMLEVYQAYADYTDMMELVQHLVLEAASAALGSTVVQNLSGEKIDLALPWRRATMAELVLEFTGERIEASMEVEEARAALARLGIGCSESWGAGRCLVEAFEGRVEAELSLPTIVTGYPVETTPLARHCRTDPTLTERFEVFVFGMELANAYSELNDPIEQRERFIAERLGEEHTAEGPHNPMVVDQSYLQALDHGLPPTGGLGIGIDRLVMLLTNSSSIRDVILFPTMRSPHRAQPEAIRGSEIVPTTPLPTASLSGAHVSAVRLSGLVRVVALLTTIVGVLTMLSGVPALSARTRLLDELVTPLPFVIANAALCVGIGSCIVLLSGQLLRGKRRAWSLALMLFVLSAGFSLVNGGEAIALTASLSMIVILLLTRSEFTGLADPPSLLRVARTVPRFFVVVYLYGLMALWVQRGTLAPGFNLGDSLWAVTAGLVGARHPYRYSGRFASLFPASLEVLGVIGLLLLLWLLLRPAVRGRVGEGRDRASAMIEQFGWDTLAPFAFRNDKSYFFSSDGLAMVAYGYLGGFALVSGDPIGEDSSIPLVVDEFILYCQHHGWQPAFLAVREVDIPLYAERGFRSFYLGDEAILDCRSFSLDAEGMAPVRQAVRRAEKIHRFELMTEEAASPDLVAELNQISLLWRKGEDERGYTMSMGADVGSGTSRRLLAVAWQVEADGTEFPAGFLRLVPTSVISKRFAPGQTLDLMRRRPDAANGLTEYLIAHTVEELRELGVVRLSLNFAAFGRLLDNDVQLTRGNRFLRMLVDLLNPYYQIRSLRDFNEKFQPIWLPRVLVYADPADLPKVGLRYAWLEGLVSLPLLGRLLSGPTEVAEGEAL